MFEPKIKLDRELYARVARIAETAGYSSVDEFVVPLLEQAAADVDRAQGKDQVRQRLQGLGYLE